MDEVKHLQAMIKHRLAEKGMSLSELAERIFVEDHDEDDPSSADSTLTRTPIPRTSGQ